MPKTPKLCDIQSYQNLFQMIYLTFSGATTWIQPISSYMCKLHRSNVYCTLRRCGCELFCCRKYAQENKAVQSELEANLFVHITSSRYIHIGIYYNRIYHLNTYIWTHQHACISHQYNQFVTLHRGCSKQNQSWWVEAITRMYSKMVKQISFLIDKSAFCKCSMQTEISNE